MWAWTSPTLGHSRATLNVHFQCVFGILNVFFWPIVADQEPRISGVFCVRGTATLGRSRKYRSPALARFSVSRGRRLLLFLHLTEAQRKPEERHAGRKEPRRGGASCWGWLGRCLSGGRYDIRAPRLLITHAWVL